jgi:hypothetical protein
MSNGGQTSAGSLVAGIRNLLRPLSPTLRISVRLGDLDVVFQPVTTVLGKKQRLQALGYYYEVISAAAGNTVTEAYTNCLQAMQTQRQAALAMATPFANVAAVEGDLQNQIRNFVVQGGALPPAGGRVDVYLPGALTFSTTNDLGSGGVADGGSLPSIRFNDEATLWTGNPALGKIPIIATVQEQSENGSWSPSPNKWVHFQLIPPFYDASTAELIRVNGLRNQSEQGTATGSIIASGIGPRPYITKAIGFNFTPDDPQRYNCHSGRGGKRGFPVSPNIFDALPAAAFPGMNAPQGSRRPNAVREQTNAKGEAGVLFLPSRMGGDAYRLRIFVDPIGIRGSDGTGAAAVWFETGRFEVVKHILWSRNLLKPVPVLPPANTAKGIQARLSILGYDVGAVDGLFQGLSKAALLAFQGNNPPLPLNGHMHDVATQNALNAAYNAYLVTIGQPLGAVVFATVGAQFSSINCAVDSTPAQATPVMTAADYKAAIHWARAQAHANQAAYGLSQLYNINVMVDDTFNTPHLFTMCHLANYNRNRNKGAPVGAGVPAAVPGPPPPKNYWTDFQNLIYAENGLLQLFLRYITGNASATNAPTANLTRYSTPGLTVVRSLSASQLMFAPNQPGQVQVVLPPPPANNPGRASGIATKERGCSVFYGSTYYTNWPYQGDGLTANTMHEMGHTLYLRHHRTVAGGLHNSASFSEDHDGSDRCLMGYLYCEGQYCGKCQLKIRGWDISKMPPY